MVGVGLNQQPKQQKEGPISSLACSTQLRAWTRVSILPNRYIVTLDWMPKALNMSTGLSKSRGTPLCHWFCYPVNLVRFNSYARGVVTSRALSNQLTTLLLKLVMDEQRVTRSIFGSKRPIAMMHHKTTNLRQQRQRHHGTCDVSCTGRSQRGSLQQQQGRR